MRRAGSPRRAATAPIDQIVGATANDSLTMITCAGTVNRQTGQYDQRAARSYLIPDR